MELRQGVDRARQVVEHPPSGGRWLRIVEASQQVPNGAGIAQQRRRFVVAGLAVFRGQVIENVALKLRNSDMAKPAAAGTAAMDRDMGLR